MIDANSGTQLGWGEKLFIRARSLFPDGARYLESYELDDGRLIMHVSLPDAADVTVFWGGTLGESYVDMGATRFTAPSTREALQLAFGRAAPPLREDNR